jgi:signal transduction histidine kinase
MRSLLLTLYRKCRPKGLRFRLRFRLIDQLIGFFVLIVLIPLLILSFSIYDINQKAVQKQVRHFTEYTIDAAYQALRLEMNWQQTTAQHIARDWENSFRQQASTKTRQQRFLFELYPDLISVRKVPLTKAASKTSNSKTIRSSELAPPQNIPNTGVAFQLTTQLTPQQTNDYQLHAWVLSQDKKSLWHIERRFHFLSKLIQNNQQQFHQSFALVSPAGQIIAGTPDFENQQLPKTLFLDYKRLKAGEQLDINEQSKVTKRKDDDNFGGEKSHKILIKMANPDWGFILESPYSLQKEYIQKAKMQSILLVIACIILIILLGTWYSQNIYRNFRQLIKGIQALGEGNYARQIRLIKRTFTPHEIIYLTTEFNVMASKISDAWADIKQLNDALADANTKLSKLDDMKSNLIDTVSHELRTPLTSIKGYTSRLIRNYDAIPKADQIKSLKVVKQQADRLGRLVEDLLVIPDIERDGGLRLFLDTVDIIPILQRAVSLIQDRSERPIEFYDESQAMQALQPNASVLVTADPDRLEQVIVNLLDNAVKYADAERPEAIQVTLIPSIPTTTENAHIQIRIWNPCETISQDDLNSLFDKFVRLDERLTRTTRGTGLGLFITRGLIEAMSGHIRLHSDNGFTVTVDLPAATISKQASDDELLCV